jgi:hypothetical protein
MAEKVAMNDAGDPFAPLTDNELGGRKIEGRLGGEEGELVTPIPLDAPPPPKRHSRLGDPTARWTYRNPAGEDVGHIERFDRPDHEKEFLPLTLHRTANGLRWLRKALPAPRPLYGLELLAARPEAPVLICEGEKSVDAARRIFPDYVVTTSSGGAKAFNQTDWIPLSRRPAVLWPDNDKAGAEYGRAVARILTDLDCEVSIIDVASLVEMDGGNRDPDRSLEGWDAADAGDEWVDMTALREAALRLVKPFVPTVPLYPEGAGEQKFQKTGGESDNPEKGYSPRYSGTAGTVFKYDAVLKRIGELGRFDEAGAQAIVADVIQAGFPKLAVEALIKPLAKALGVKESAARTFWKDTETQLRAAATAQTSTAIAEQRARLEREHAEERLRLSRSCREIAESPTLLADMEAMVRRLGVVGESAAIRGAYLTASSRLNSESAICLLRRGAPAGGKNFLISKVLALIPAESVVHMSSGSPLSLVYYGGGDEDALKHKIVYVPEAAIIAEKNGAESPLTVMLRLLISEGRLDHNVALPQEGGMYATVHIIRNGPVVVIITSARDDVEDELLTRLMTSDPDESPKQTLAVLANVLSIEDREVSESEVERWLDYQRRLTSGAPYKVAIPFRGAILAAYNNRLRDAEARREKPNVQLRLRRDVHGFLTAIKTSAILHQANRETDESDRIIATVDDYRHAHEAFEEGLARLYKIKTPDTALAVVRAVEAIGASPTLGVEVTVSALMEKLGITSRGTASGRLKDAADRGFLKLVERAGGYGRTSPRVYEIAKSSEEIAKDIVAKAAPGVFPSPEEVEREISKRGSTPRYSGTVGTVGSNHRNYTDCTTVPGGIPPSDSNFAIEKATHPSVDPEKSENPLNPAKWVCEL